MKSTPIKNQSEYGKGQASLRLGIYFIPSPVVYEIVQKIEQEVAEGNRSYIHNGHFYASPEEDPTFNDGLMG